MKQTSIEEMAAVGAVLSRLVVVLSLLVFLLMPVWRFLAATKLRKSKK